MTMKWEASGYKSEIARVQGLGTARHGPSHWIHQRLTALANLVLVAWFILAMTGLIRDGATYSNITLWVQTGINPVLLILLCLSLFYHALLGLQIIIEDYVHHEGVKIVALVAVKFSVLTLAAVCVFSVLKIAL